MTRTIFQVSALFAVLVLLVFAFACGGPPQGDGHGTSSGSASAEIPDLTAEVISERINDTGVYDVGPESGTGEPIPWNFDEDEPKEIVIVDKQVQGASATIILDIKTSSSPRSRVNRHLAGQIKTEWLLETGWVLRRWEIVRTENISMKYRDLPKVPEQNVNR